MRSVASIVVSAVLSLVAAGLASGCAPGTRGPFLTTINGPLQSADVNQSRTIHDAAAGATEKKSRDQGDVGHQPMIGSGLLGTSAQAFLSVDQWTNRANMAGFYNDPALGQAFAQLLSAPPTLIQFQRQDWHTWGALNDTAGAATVYWVQIRGHLKSADLKASETIHDQAAVKSEKASREAGDIAHVVFVGLNDPQQFLAIDVWKTSNGLENFYANPDLQAGFGQLFDGPPTIGVYQTTDWTQW